MSQPHPNFLGTSSGGMPPFQMNTSGKPNASSSASSASSTTSSSSQQQPTQSGTQQQIESHKGSISSLHQQQQQQQHLQLLQQQQQLQQQMQQYLASQHFNLSHPPHPQSFNLSNTNPLSSMGNTSTSNTILSPSTPTLHTMASPGINASTPHHQFSAHSHGPPHSGHYSNASHSHSHSANYDISSYNYSNSGSAGNMKSYPHQQSHAHSHSHSHQAPQHCLTPQQNPQTSAPSVASLTSFASMPSIGATSLLNVGGLPGNLAASSFASGGTQNMFGAMGNQFGNANQNNANNNNNNNGGNNNNGQQGNANGAGGNAGNGNNNGGGNGDGNNNNNGGNGDGDDEQKVDEQNQDEGPSAVLGQPPNSIIVNVSSNNKYGLRNYLVRARRILRLAKTAKICGIGSAVSVACEVTEVLKREKVARVMAITTDLIEDSVSTRPTIEVVVERGEFAHLVSDFRRRKVIEVFEKKDSEIRGTLSFDFVRKMDLATKFKADPYRTHQAQKYLQNLENAPEWDAVDLPRFIHYCSIIIHPLLLEYHFKMAISELGGYVDVHDGHLPKEHTEERVQQLQKLGRIEPFLAEDDDIEFNPDDFKHWFTDNSSNRGGSRHGHYDDHYNDSQGGGYYEDENYGGSSHHDHGHSHSHSHYDDASSSQYNNYFRGNNQSSMQPMRSSNQPPPNYPNPMHHNRGNNDYDDHHDHDDNETQDYLHTDASNHSPDNDGNTTVNAVDGGSICASATTGTGYTGLVHKIIGADDQPPAQQASAVQPAATHTVHDRQHGQMAKKDAAIPEDESVTQDVDVDKEIQNNLGDHEEDDSSQVHASSDASKATTVLTTNTEL